MVGNAVPPSAGTRCLALSIKDALGSMNGKKRKQTFLLLIIKTNTNYA